MKRLSSPWTCAGCGLVLLNVFLFATTAAAQLAVNPSTLNFGSVPIGTSVSKSVALSNTGSSNLTISQATVSGTGFSKSGLSLPLTLAPGHGVSLTTTFTAQAGCNTRGSLRLSYSVLKARYGRYRPPTGTATVSLTSTVATPGQLAANPSSLNFGNVQPGNSLTLMDSLTNTGGAGVTISKATVAGAGFSISGLNVPFTLSPGASVTFSAVFAPPPSAGSASGSMSVSSDASNPTLTVSLSGTTTAQGQLTLTPTALNFGNVTVGTHVSQASSLSASGASVIVSSASLSSGEFSLTGVSFPLTIAAGQSVPFTVTFAPQTSGSANAPLSFTSNASNSPSETLSGTGDAAPQHSVSLSWTDSGSGVVGYYVYRGGVSKGPYSKITTAVDTPAAYTDNTVVAGQTYYYVTTAVDGTGTESAYSNEAKAVIPTP